MMLCTHFPEVFQVGNEDRDSFNEVGVCVYIYILYEAMAG